MRIILLGEVESKVALNFLQLRLSQAKSRQRACCKRRTIAPDAAKEAKQKNDKSAHLSSYIAYEKAMDYEKQLKDIIISTRGIKGWNKFEQFRREAKKNERETRYAAIRKRNE